MPPAGPDAAPTAPDAGTSDAGTSPPGAAEGPATVEEARAFVDRYNEEAERVALELGKAAWVQSTYITGDTQWLNAKAQERFINFQNAGIEESKRFNDLSLEGELGRAIQIIKLGVTMPAPRDAAKVAELTKLSTGLEATYGQGKHCRDGKCRDLQDLMKVMAQSRDEAELRDAWVGWRTISPPMRDDYTRFAALMNEGAKELGFADTGDLWKSGYDMSASEFEAEAERLWNQVKPLYEQLHCYVRGRLSKRYGAGTVPEDGLIPAHLLGNMWAQEWNNIYDLVRPFPAQGKVDIDKALVAQKYDAEKMVRSAESFYTSLGLRPLPDTFWKRSMFVKPEDREVVCHASAWDIQLADDDVRIKMCIEQTQEDLVVIYHELGHIYYYLYYKDQPFLFQSGAHDGFHEAIGDALTLSMTPSFYEKIGLATGPRQKNERALINEQMKMALEKIAFLPFGKLIDQWRWDVFSGKVKPSEYNAAWWRLRKQYQGIAPPVPRDESHFDPGAKYHIPANTPYTRYFLARILQFQFHQAMCQAAGFEGPLHECSIHGSEAAGKKLAATLSMGRSRPWADALEAMTGKRQMDGSAIIDYFAPLMAWLEKENQGKTCGW